MAGRGSIGAAWRSRAWRLALALAAVAATLPSPAAAAEQYDGGWALFLDNDALTFGTHDHDYTGGLALTLAGRRAQDWPVSLDGALGWINHGLGVERAHRPPASQWHALQVSLLTFTPAALEQPSPIAGDRPYASIVYLANSRTTVVDADSAYQSSFAVGVLGLDLGKAVQRTLHSAIAADEPRGWDHQISDGGEPTARYTLARLGLQSAFQADGGSRLELKDSVAVSAGYITEVNAAMTLRWGAIHTPWWSFVPERAEYMTEPAPVLGGRAAPGAAREFYAWAGVKARARLYNAFLQGQFRDSDLTYDFDDTRPLMGELWAGVTKEFADGYRLSWVLRYQSSELRTEPGDRDLYWGGVSVSRSL